VDPPGSRIQLRQFSTVNGSAGHQVSMSIQIPISYGELIDKITILEIKFARIDDPGKRANVERELTVLNDAWHHAGVDAARIAPARRQLKAINERLWDIEDAIRDKEAAKTFDDAFTELARSVYQTNDERAAVKRIINEQLGSDLIEEKSYQPY
tara:strand:+ start:512 stop:973 length:462 start_codon:yes stop_codon:yes gene_type:complete